MNTYIKTEKVKDYSGNEHEYGLTDCGNGFFEIFEIIPPMSKEHQKLCADAGYPATEEQINGSTFSIGSITDPENFYLGIDNHHEEVACLMEACKAEFGF